MPVVKLSSKGQITIPKQVRDALRLDTGDRLSFLVRDDGVIELRPEKGDLRDQYGMLSCRGELVEVERMDEDAAEAAAESFEESVEK
ncbi:MAG: AbrB/MazE/SpoVT family DNA-binding domain-containing protein [Deltaproteobacteria bacterium]|nr:AbrB/MazE/SpoVT family DNA-binding domain-containing protein [Deltaproteobacteria bacterium]